MLIDMHMLLALFIFALQMHTDMGDERGIWLRCICLGRAALRAYGDHGCVAWVCVEKARNLGLPDPLPRSLVLVCALSLGVLTSRLMQNSERYDHELIVTNNNNVETELDYL